MQQYFVLTLVVVFFTVQATNYQAIGTFTDSQIGKIWHTIDTAVDQRLDYTSVARNLSDTFNSEWGEAWNVVVVWQAPPYQGDAVVFANSFRAHWFWSNNHGELHQSFIIWKDFLCGQWFDYNTRRSDEVASFPYQEVGKSIRATLAPTFRKLSMDPKKVGDVWSFGHEGVWAYQNANTVTASIVVFNFKKEQMSSRFCAMKEGYWAHDMVSVDLVSTEVVTSYLVFETA